MDWESLIAEVIIALIPILATALTALAGYGAAYLRQRYAWAREARTVAAVEDALRSLIAETQQTTVEKLKAAREDEKLTPEEALAVKQQVLSQITRLMTDEQRRVLAAITEDVGAWLSARLEQLLTEHKAAQSAVQARVGEIASPKSSPSGTSAPSLSD